MLESVFTLEEISQHLRVPIDVLQQEIASGHLQALNIAGHIRVAGSDLDQFKQQARNTTQHKPASADGFLQVRPGADFVQKWMKEGDDEPFGNVQEGIARHMGHDYQVKIGFAIRKAAGKDRVRVLVLIDRYPTVEFVGADAEIGGEGRIASIIKDCKKKHVPAGAEIPPEYVGFQVGPYRDVVNGPGAAYGMAVICAQNDYETMVRHALIRYTYPQS